MYKLQQQDQVARMLRTVDFWLIVCWDTHVLTTAIKWATSTAFAVPSLLYIQYVLLWWFCARKFHMKHTHSDYPATLTEFSISVLPGSWTVATICVRPPVTRGHVLHVHFCQWLLPSAPVGPHPSLNCYRMVWIEYHVWILFPHALRPVDVCCLVPHWVGLHSQLLSQPSTLVLCPDPTLSPHEERVWCHKPESLGLWNFWSLVIVSVELQITKCWIMNLITCFEWYNCCHIPNKCCSAIWLAAPSFWS